MCGVTASAPAAHAAPAPELNVESVREALQLAGFTVGTPVAWDEHVVVVEAWAPSDAYVVRVFVFATTAVAEAARRRAQAQQATTLDAPLSFSNDAGPQLVSGYGASAWRRNVAVVQSTRDSFGLLMPAEIDCFTGAPGVGLAASTLRSREFRVEPAVIALIDDLQ
jgi:hypothetical protein